MSQVDAPRLPNLLLTNRNFLILWLAAGISAVGDHLSEMALLYELGGVDRPDVTRVQALMTFSFFLPYVIVAPLAGWWADRFARRTTMILSDVLRGGVMLSLVVMVPFLLRSGWGDFTLVLPLMLTGFFAAFFSPARQALLPTLIRDDQLVRANALVSAVGVIGAITSGVLGGQLVDWAQAGYITIETNFYLDAVTFAVSAGLLVFMSMKLARPARKARLTSVWGPVRQGFRYVRTHKRVFQVIVLGTIFWAAAGVVISVVPAIVRDVFSGSFKQIGLYRGLLAAGMAIGSGVLTILGSSISIPLLVLGALSGAAFWVLMLDVAFLYAAWGSGIFGLPPDTVATIGKFATATCLVLIGAHGAGLLVTVMVCIQRFVPNERRGRVFGVSDMCTMGAITAATGLLGLPAIPNLDKLVPLLLLLVFAGLTTALVVAWRIYRRGESCGPALSIVFRVVQLYARFWARMKVDGRCTMPRQGPVIIASNHSSGVDPILIQAACPRFISWLVAEEHYRVPIANWFQRLVECIPVNRERPQKSALAESLKRLRDGRVLGVFPRGRFERPGEAAPEARVGLAALALRTGATIVPCRVDGTTFHEKPLRGYLARHRARLRFGRPIAVEARRDATDAEEQALLERVMQAIEELRETGPQRDGIDASA